MPQLTNRRAVITGAGSGIGAAIARAYAAEGARLLLADRNAVSLAETAVTCRNLGAQVFECLADVGTVEGAQASVDRCVEHFGGIDILVNNAGMLTQARCVDLTIEMWNDMLRVDLTSVFVASQRALPHMLAQGWGRIINVASQLGIKGGAELTHYAAAKAGVIGFTKSLALEVAKDNVLVNAIAPGPIETPLVGGDQRHLEARQGRRTAPGPLRPGRRSGADRCAAGQRAGRQPVRRPDPGPELRRCHAMSGV